MDCQAKLTCLEAGGFGQEGCLMAASGAGLRKMDRWSAADTCHWDSGWGVISCDCSAHVRKPHIDTVSFNVLLQILALPDINGHRQLSWMEHCFLIIYLYFTNPRPLPSQFVWTSPQEGLHLFYNPLRSHRESINLWPSLDMHYYLVIVSPARIKKIGWVVVVFIFSQCNCSPLSWDDNLILRVQGCVETAP